MLQYSVHNWHMTGKYSFTWCVFTNLVAKKFVHRPIFATAHVETSDMFTKTAKTSHTFSKKPHSPLLYELFAHREQTSQSQASQRYVGSTVSKEQTSQTTLDHSTQRTRRFLKTLRSGKSLTNTECPCGQKMSTCFGGSATGRAALEEAPLSSFTWSIPAFG